MKKILDSYPFWNPFYNGIRCIVRYLFQGVRHGLGKIHFQRCITLFLSQMHQFSTTLEQESLRVESLYKLKKITQGLHTLLPKDRKFTYSILIPVEVPVPLSFFRHALQSALEQTAPEMEILVGFNVPLSKEFKGTLEQFQETYPEKIKTFFHTTSPLPNFLGKQATGNFLLLLRPSDWIRPDLLFRYEQTLRLLPNGETTVLYCNEYQINDRHYPIPYTRWNKSEHPYFPYFFKNEIGQGFLIPKTLWDKVGGVCSDFSSEAFYDLLLRLDLANASFFRVPFYLYASRSSPKEEDLLARQHAFHSYLKNKKLDWELRDRALPILRHIPLIQVIVPFKDQKQLTLQAITSVLEQEGVSVKITAVDNGSQDKTIGEQLKAWGVEVLVSEEPFNYSRLNNQAVRETKQGQACELLLFLNNDVTLHSGALVEMCRWIDQPSIGMVGCRLQYPDGSLQHGGVELSLDGPASRMTWKHIERLKSFKTLELARQVRISKAVTAACALIKRSTFSAVGGFDEIWYPVAYSDTYLATKLAQKNLWCLYTPYASGMHYESASRLHHHIEDVENSSWLHHLVLE